MKKYLLAVKEELSLQFIFEIMAILAIARIPYMEKELLDSLIERRNDSILEILLVVILLIVVYSIFSWLSARFMIIRINKMRDSMQKDLFSTIIKFDKPKFVKRDIGEYITMQNKNIGIIVGDYFQPMIDLIKNIVEIVIYSLSIAIYINWKISILLILSSTIICLIPRFFESKISKKREAQVENQSKYASTVQDQLEGIRLIDSMTRENVLKIHREKSNSMNKAIYDFEFFKVVSESTYGFAVKILDIIVFITIGVALFKSQITAGTALAIFSYTHCFMSPFSNFLYDITAINSSKVVKKNFENELSVKARTFKSKKTFEKSICLENICISYPDFSLKNFNGVFVKGNKYIVTGHSGCGKSTILRLIVKETELENGKIYVDGEDINEIEVDEIISIVHQNEHIYKASFEENIRMFGSYSKENYSRVLEVISSEISSKIKDTLDCSSLSGGEKQIVSFMRALTSDKEILILDEPFSALDKKNKSHMLEILKNIEDKTIIMVSHDVKDENEKLDIRLLEDIV